MKPRRWRDVRHVTERLLPRASDEEKEDFSAGSDDYDRGVYEPPKGRFRWWYHRGARYAEHLRYVRGRPAEVEENRQRRKVAMETALAEVREAGASSWRRGASRHAPPVVRFQGRDVSSESLRKQWLRGYDAARTDYLEGLLRR